MAATASLPQRSLPYQYSGQIDYADRVYAGKIPAGCYLTRTDPYPGVHEFS